MKTILLATLLLSPLASCGHGEFIWASEIPKISEKHSKITISPGDEIEINFWKHEELNTKQITSSDGTISLMFAGRVNISGKTESEAEEIIRSKISNFIIDPNISVKIIQPKIRYASVIGEVKRPGTYTLENDETIFHLLARAGGLTEYADHDSIYIIREKDNLKRIRFKFNDLNTGEPQLIFFPIEDGDILFAE